MMYADKLPEVVNMVQSVLNNSLLTRLNKRTPMQVFTGHAETAPLALMLKLSNAMTEIHAWRKKYA
jgi:hypothetical protein